MESKKHEPDFMKHAESLGAKKVPMKFKTFVMLFFQEQMQNANAEIKHLKDVQKFYKKNMEKLLPLSDADCRKHLKDIPDLLNAYEDMLKLSRGEEIEP
jgi:hypothetical protein